MGCKVSKEEAELYAPVPPMEPREIRVIMQDGLIKDVEVGEDIVPLSVLIRTVDYDAPENMDPTEKATECNVGEDNNLCSVYTESPEIVK